MLVGNMMVFLEVFDNRGEPIDHGRIHELKSVLLISLPIFVSPGQFAHQNNQLLLNRVHLFLNYRVIGGCSKYPKRGIELVD